MSQRGFHIYYISLVTLLSFAIAAAVFAAGYDPRFGKAVAAFGVLMALYGVWFIRKSRKLIL